MKYLVISALLAALAFTPIPAESAYLVPGERVERTLEVGTHATFELPSITEQSVLVRVEQRGIDVELRLLRSGELVTRRGGLNGTWGTELLVLDTGPELVLEVAAIAADGGPVSYVLQLSKLETGSDQAQAWRVADQAMTSALEDHDRRTRETLTRAVEDFHRAEKIWRRLEEPELQAEAFYGAASAYQRLGLGDQALRDFTHARTLFEHVGRRQGTARAWNRIGQVQGLLGRAEDAISSYGRSLDSWRELGNVAMQGSVLSNLGNRYQHAGELRRALEHYEKALDLMRSTPDQHNVATALNNIGAVYANLGEPDLALARYQEALAGAKKQKSRTLEANILINLGHLRRKMGEMQLALHTYLDVLRIHQQLEDPRSMATALNNLGVLHHELGQPELGIERLRDALLLRRRTGDQPGEAVTLTRLGAIWTWQGDLMAARDVLQRALLLQLQNPRRPASEASTRGTLGAVYTELGQIELARHQLQATLTLARDPKKPNPQRELNTLWQIGNVDMIQGKLEAAHRAFSDSLELSRRRPRSARGEVQALQGLGRVEMARGRLDPARAYLEQALRVIETRRAKVVDPLLRARFHGRQQDTHELYLELLLRLARERRDPAFEHLALEASERARARGLVELLSEAKSEVLRKADPELAARRQSLAGRLNTKAGRAAGLNPSNPEQARELALLEGEIENLIEDKTAVEVKIRHNHPRYAALLQPPEVDSRKIQKSLLEDRTLLLEYSLGSERSYLWAVSRKSLHTFDLPPRGVVEEAVRQGYAELSRRRVGNGPKRCEALAALGEMLVGPANKLLGDRRLAIVPDGALYSLPFAALPDPRGAASPCARPPLVERHEITQWPSAAAMLEQRSRLADRAPASRGLAIFADPVFHADDPRVSVGPAKRARNKPMASFERLPWSRREAEAILEVVQNRQQVFHALDFEARRENVAQLRDYRLIHFATHGVLDHERPELSGLVLSLVDDKGCVSNGILRLHDLYDLELHADLVVLSGCRTALGQEIRGEGLVGLTQGFFYAGAARVLASLWQVDDQATAELMGRFYRQLVYHRASPSAALRTAQRSLRGESRWRDPYYWAGFIVQGE